MLDFLFTKTPLLFFVQNFWRDEAFTYILAKRSVLDILQLTAKDFNPPLYYLSIHYWIGIFGSSEIAMRSFSVIFFWATVYIIYLFLTETMNVSFKRAVAYLGLFVINPLLLYYGFEARMYSMFAFFATASFYFFYKKKYGWFTLITVLGLYTHYFMVFVVAAEAIILLIEQRRKLTKKHFKNLLVPFLFFLPWIAYVALTKRADDGSFWIQFMTLHRLVTVPVSLYTGYELVNGFYKNAQFLNILLYTIFFVSTFFTLRDKKLKRDSWYMFIVWTFVSFFVALVSFVKPIFLPRYLIFSTVGFLLLIVWSLERMPRVLRLLCILALIFFTVQYQSLQIKNFKKADMNKVAREIKAISKPSDLIYVTNQLDYFTAAYYFGENRVYIYNKPYNEIPNYVGKILIPREKVVYSLPTYPTKAFILNANLSYTIKAAY